jgi:N-acetylglucosaminyldiphosphoundecaprenol N-acetyl-beta-D-mannosaminyltransferase
MFINVFKVAEYHANPTLRACLDRADMVAADGVPIVWASRLVRKTLPGRVAGADLMESVLAMCNEQGYTVFLLGAREQVLAKTVSVLRERYPKLRIVGSRHGYFDQQEETAVVDEINSCHPQVLFLGMSSPRKELFATRNAQRLTATVSQCVGGYFEIIAGETRRASHWMQVVGLEWLYRLLQEPGRLWRRYLFSGVRFARLMSIEILQAWTARLSPKYRS